MKKIVLLLIVSCLLVACEQDKVLNPVVQPIAQTDLPENITSQKATLKGKALDGGGTIQERGFIYLDNAKGIITDKTKDEDANKILSTQGKKVKVPLEGDFEYQLTELKSETEYCVQAYLNSEKGCHLGHIVFFSTSAQVPPSVSINPEYEKENGTTNVSITATLHSSGGDEVLEQGFVWSKNNATPTIEDGQVILSDINAEDMFETTIYNMEWLRKYHVRAFARNSFGVSYSGSVMVFFMSDTFTDPRDNEVYTVKQYGNSIWFTQNFRHIPENAINHEIWVQQYSGNSVSEAKSSKYYSQYGCLYSFRRAKELAPEGWHLPTDAEWQELEILTGMSPEAANIENDWRGNTNGKLKAETWEGVGSWNNSMGFNLHPGGKQWCGGAFQNVNEHGYFWTSTINEHRPDGQKNAYFRFFSPGPATGRFSDFPECVGMSVRYVMNQ